MEFWLWSWIVFLIAAINRGFWESRMKGNTVGVSRILAVVTSVTLLIVLDFWLTHSWYPERTGRFTCTSLSFLAGLLTGLTLFFGGELKVSFLRAIVVVGAIAVQFYFASL